MQNAEWVTVVLYFAFCILSSAFLSGCADNTPASTQPTTKPLTTEQRQQQMLEDPFGAGPKDDPDYLAKHGLGPDGKPTLKSDLDKFFNP